MSTNVFPKEQFAVEVCNHRWGKQMTYCDNCDTLTGTNYMPIMLWYFRNNIKGGLFVAPSQEAQMKMAADLEKCGVLNNSIYCTFGSTDQRTMNENTIAAQKLFKKFLSRISSTYSYSGGDESYYRTAARFFIGARDNDYGDFGHPYTFFGKSFPTGTILGSLEVPAGNDPRTGFNRYDEMKHFMSMRWCDEAGAGPYGGGGKYHHGWTVAQTIAALIDDVQTTYGNKGFYNAFAHWHYLNSVYDVTVAQYGDYINALGAIMVSGVSVADNIHFCGFDEAMEYMMARQMLKKIACYAPADIPNALQIVAYFANDVAPQFDLSCFSTPLTIKIDLTGTPLAGKAITTNYGTLMRIGSTSQYYVELPVPRNGNISGVVISESYGNGYAVGTKPTITATLSDGVITFGSNQFARNTSFCIFRRVMNADEATAQIIGFKHGVKSIQVEKQDGYEYAVGCSVNYDNGHYVALAASNWV